MESRAQKLKLVRGEHTLIVGVDVAKKKHWVRIIDAQTGLEPHKPFSIQNNKKSFSSLLGRISRSIEKTGASKAIIGMEPSGHYWKPLAHYMLGAGFTVVTVNPHHVKKSKELDDNSPTKSDRKDAWVIATLISEGRFFHCFLPRGIWAELRGYTKTRWQYRSKLNSAKNTLVAILDEYFPEYLEVFKNLLGKASLYILTQRPFPSDLEQVSEEELTWELKSASKGKVGENRARLLIEKAQNSIGVPEGMESARLKLKQCLEEIEFLQNRLSETEIAMAEMLEKTGLANYLLSIPGIGVVTAASFLGEIGNITCYDNWRQIRKLAGYNLTENSSGMKQYGPTVISKRGRPGLRCILYQATLVLVAKNQQFKALYHYFKNRQHNPLKRNQALVAVACKLLRVMFTLAKAGRIYDSYKVLGEFRKNQLETAV